MHINNISPNSALHSLTTATQHHKIHQQQRLLVSEQIPAVSSTRTTVYHYSSAATAIPATSSQFKAVKMVRMVTFGTTTEGARDPLSDEREVMRTFHKHVKHCDTCYSSLSSWRSETSLCSRGQSYVVDMKPYFFCKEGKVYSLIDRQRRNDNTRVLVPSEYRHVSTLFEAMNAGYSPAPARRPQVVVHQRTPQVVNREPRRERPAIVIPTERYVTTTRTPQTGDRSPRSGERHYREPRSRGSLYHEDERRRHRHDEHIVYAAPSRYHL